MTTGALDDRALALDQQLCFALYAATRAVTARYRPILAPLGLTYPQYLVMLVLWEEGEASVRTLGERLELDSGTLSPLLARLEASGRVTRRRRAEDERSVLVSLTPAGRALRERAETVPCQVAEATGLTPPEIADLRDALRALAARVRPE